jgi:hypothetical protein
MNKRNPCGAIRAELKFDMASLANPHMNSAEGVSGLLLILAGSHKNQIAALGRLRMPVTRIANRLLLGS